MHSPAEKKLVLSTAILWQHTSIARAIILGGQGEHFRIGKQYRDHLVKLLPFRIGKTNMHIHEAIYLQRKLVKEHEIKKISGVLI